MLRDKFESVWPKGFDRFGGVVEVDDPAIGLVVILHVAEYVVVDVAEEVDLGFYAPVPADILQGWVMIEEPRVPTAHLVVRSHSGVLNTFLSKDLSGLFHKVIIDPCRLLPMIGGDKFCIDAGR